MRRLMVWLTTCVRKAFWCCAVAGAALPGSRRASAPSAGTVTDTTGSVLPGATVTLTSPEATVGANQETVTDQRGAFQFLRLVPGTVSRPRGAVGLPAR